VAEGPKCGAITTQVLKQAWDARAIECREGETAMALPRW
jgi:hypothetical protein